MGVSVGATTVIVGEAVSIDGVGETGATVGETAGARVAVGVGAKLEAGVSVGITVGLSVAVGGGGSSLGSRVGAAVLVGPEDEVGVRVGTVCLSGAIAGAAHSPELGDNIEMARALANTRRNPYLLMSPPAGGGQ